MKLAVEKMVMLSTGPDNMSWNISSDEPNHEMLPVGKYLGIEINVKGRNLIRSKKKMISTTRPLGGTSCQHADLPVGPG